MIFLQNGGRGRAETQSADTIVAEKQIWAFKGRGEESLFFMN